jgi:hypothetical protein
VRPSGFAGAEDRGLPAPGSFHWKDAG